MAQSKQDYLKKYLSDDTKIKKDMKKKKNHGIMIIDHCQTETSTINKSKFRITQVTNNAYAQQNDEELDDEKPMVYQPDGKSLAVFEEKPNKWAPINQTDNDLKPSDKSKHKNNDDSILKDGDGDLSIDRNITKIASNNQTDKLIVDEDGDLSPQRNRKVNDKVSDKLATKEQKNATIYRDKDGRKIDIKLEQLKKRRADEERMEQIEKYMEWGKGLKQQKDLREKVADDMVEMSKPLARYVDDKDYDKRLKDTMRLEDPMLNFFMSNKNDDNQEDVDHGKKNIYNISHQSMNRFNIKPGYRWDGVDRSNGFEKRRFESLAESKAFNKELYMWSVEDM